MADNITQEPEITQQEPFNFEEKFVSALKDPNVTDRTALGNIITQSKEQFNQQFGDVGSKVRSGIKKDWKGFTTQGIDIGGGYRAITDVKQDEASGIGTRQYHVLDPQGNIVGTTSGNSTQFMNDASTFIAKSKGYGNLGAGFGGYESMNDLIKQYAPQAGLEGITDLESFETARRPVVAMAVHLRSHVRGTSQEQADQAVAFGFQPTTAPVDVQEGQAPVAEPTATVQAAGFDQGGQPSTGWVDPATGQPTPVGVGEPEANFIQRTGGTADSPANQGPLAGLTKIGNRAELDRLVANGLTEDQIVRDPNSDAIYLRETVNAGTQLPTATTEPTTTTLPEPKNLTEVTADTPRFQLKAIVSNLATQNGNNVLADADYVQNAFQALHGRAARKHEVAEMSGKGQQDVYNAILAGVPGGSEPAKLEDLIEKSGDTRISVDEGTGEVIGGRTTPGDLSATVGGQVALDTMNQIEKMINNFLGIQAAEIGAELGAADAEEDVRKAQMEKIRTDNTLEKAAEKWYGDGSRIDEILDDLKSMRGKLMGEIESMKLGEAAIGERVAPMELILGRQRAINTQGMARIGALNAGMNAAIGEGNLAIQVSNKIYGAIEKDRTNQINALQDLLDLAVDDRVDLETEEKDNIKAQISLLEDANDRMNDEKADIQKLITDDPLLAAAAGVSLIDTLDEALAKIQAGAGDKNSEVYRLLNIDNVKSSGGSGGGTPTANDQQLISDALAFLNERKGADGFVNTADYQTVLNSLGATSIKALKSFQEQFPAGNLLNPQDATAQRFIAQDFSAAEKAKFFTEDTSQISEGTLRSKLSGVSTAGTQFAGLFTSRAKEFENMINAVQTRVGDLETSGLSDSQIEAVLKAEGVDLTAGTVSDEFGK